MESGQASLDLTVDKTETGQHKWVRKLNDTTIPVDECSTNLRGLPVLPCSTIDRYVEEGSSQAVDGGGQKAKNEGWAMFREDHVRSIEIWTGSDELGHVLVRALVRASFRVRVQYRVVCIFYSNPVSRVRAHCNCPAGALGSCKHVSAVLFRFWDLQQLGEEVVPPSKSVTDVPSYWMQPSSSRSRNAMKWQDILIVKHKCPPSIGMDADRKVHSQRDRAEKLAKRRHERRAAFEPLPVQHRLVTSGAIRAMCRDLESIGSGSVVRGLLESNDCQSTLFRRDAVVYHDHPFMVPSKPPPSCRDKVSWPSHMLFPPLVRALPLPDLSTIKVENMHGITLTVAVQDLLLLKNVCLSAAGAQRLEERTREQNKSALRMSARSKRLTASLFGRVCKMRDTTNRQPLVDQIISSRNVSTMAT